MSSCVKLIDFETKKSLYNIDCNYDKNNDDRIQQINKIAYSNIHNILVTGHENKYIRFFDVRDSNNNNNNKIIKSIIGHTDSISSLEFGINEYELITASHDGSIRYWDIRNFNLLHDVTCHKRKSNEGVLNMVVNKTLKSVFSCGADGLIKGFKMFK